jgi:hypothetical protein
MSKIDRSAEVADWLAYRELPPGASLKELIELEREIATLEAARTAERTTAVPVRAVPQTWSSHMGNACFAVALPRVGNGDRISVTFDDNDNVWDGVVLGVRPGVGAEVWIDAAPAERQAAVNA